MLAIAVIVAESWGKVMSKIIDELLQEEKALMDELTIVRRELGSLKMQRCFEKYGVRTGGVVKVGDVVYLVTGVIPSPSGGRPFLEGRKQKRDGTFGKQSRGIYGAQIEVIKS